MQGAQILKHSLPAAPVRGLCDFRLQQGAILEGKEEGAWEAIMVISGG
jgi:hypothetical protein